MSLRPTVDFLIIVALRVELDAVLQHFSPVSEAEGGFLATVARRGGGEYRVAIVDIGDMGPDAAQRETTAAMRRFRTQRVLLVGIAAGFPEKGVEYGDIIVPQWIADYEKAKIKETGHWWRRKQEVEHRGRD